MSQPDAIRWEAAQWLERSMNDAFDREAFEGWLAGDPRRQIVFDAMHRRLMGSDMDDALHAYERRGAKRRAIVGAGVAMLLVAGVSIAAMPALELRLAEPQTFGASDGEARTVTLTDGTKLTLAAGADVKVRYTRHVRSIELSHGNLFADVTHDEKRPLRIDTGDASILDLGTSFEVSSRPGKVEVMVASGSVSFGRNGLFARSINLTPHQAATLRPGESPTRIPDVDPTEIGRWRSGWVEYHGTPLRQVIADLQRLSPFDITLTDPSLAEKHVSGRIRLTNPVQQLENLSVIYEFRIHRTGDTLVLAKE
jgi:transmembrane sensor